MAGLINLRNSSPTQSLNQDFMSMVNGGTPVRGSSLFGDAVYNNTGLQTSADAPLGQNPALKLDLNKNPGETWWDKNSGNVYGNMLAIAADGVVKDMLLRKQNEYSKENIAMQADINRQAVDARVARASAMPTINTAPKN